MSHFDQIQEVLLRHAGEWWTYLATTMLCWLDGFFPPLPSESIIIAMAALCFGHGNVQWYFLLPCAVLGALMGDNTAYWIGRLFRLERFFRSDKGRIRVWKAKKMVERRGAELLITARFIPGWRVLAMIGAGSLRFPWRRFIVADIISTMVWAHFAFAIGIASGSVFGRRPLLGVIVGIAVGLVIGVIVDKIMTALRARRSSGHYQLAERRLQHAIIAVRNSRRPSQRSAWTSTELS